MQIFPSAGLIWLFYETLRIDETVTQYWKKPHFFASNMSSSVYSHIGSPFTIPVKSRKRLVHDIFDTFATPASLACCDITDKDTGRWAQNGSFQVMFSQLSNGNLKETWWKIKLKNAVHLFFIIIPLLVLISYWLHPWCFFSFKFGSPLKLLNLQQRQKGGRPYSVIIFH